MSLMEELMEELSEGTFSFINNFGIKKRDKNVSIIFFFFYSSSFIWIIINRWDELQVPIIFAGNFYFAGNKILNLMLIKRLLK